MPPWLVLAVIADTCLSCQGVVCRSCAEACPEGAIGFRPRRAGRADPLLDTEVCTGCGYCLRVCPVGAISLHARRAEDGQ